jgi:hypothetical protein
MSRTLSLTVKIPRGYNHAPYEEELVDPVLGNYILRVAIPNESPTVDLYHKDTSNFLSPASREMDDTSVSAWFHLPEGQYVYVEVFPETTIVYLWE